MEERRLVKKITEWKPIAVRPRGRPKLKWEDDVKQVSKVMKIYLWEKQAKSRNEWKRIIEQARTHKEL
jgi:hypothetical protein